MSRKLSESLKKIIASNQDWKCLKCKSSLPPSFQVDHIIPFAISKDDTEGNLQALCPNCHSLKTQRENLRISQFKSLMLKCPEDTQLCWFCLETNPIGKEEHTCGKVMKDINKIVKEQKKALTSFEKMIEKHKYAEKDLLKSFQKMNIVQEQKVVSNILQVEICLFNLCIYVNKFAYKLQNSSDLLPSEVGEAIGFMTRSKKYTGKIDTIEIDITNSMENETFQCDKEECFDYLSDVLLDYIPEFIFKKDCEISISTFIFRYNKSELLKKNYSSANLFLKTKINELKT